MILCNQQRYAARVSLGQQQGAGASAASLPPLISFGLPADTHFDESLAIGSLPIPMEDHSLAEYDILFAAADTIRYKGVFRRIRLDRIAVISKLALRWQPVTDRLRSFQPEGIRGSQVNVTSQ